MKTCSTCKVDKPDESFSWKIQGKYRNSLCKECHKTYRKQHYKDNREKYLKKARAWEQSRGGTILIRYKLTDEDFAIMLAKHDGLCWICRRSEAKVVDHDHACCPGQYTCGKCTRGLLCIGCNTALGRLGDSKESIQRVLTYLEGV